MKNKTKHKILISIIYLLHLSFYIFMNSLTEKNILTMNRIYSKLELSSNMIEYSNIYLALFYFILSILILINALNIKTTKKTSIMIYLISYTFAIRFIYSFYISKDAINMFIVANGLIINMRFIYSKINIRNDILSNPNN